MKYRCTLLNSVATLVYMGLQKIHKHADFSAWNRSPISHGQLLMIFQVLA